MSFARRIPNTTKLCQELNSRNVWACDDDTWEARKPITFRRPLESCDTCECASYSFSRSNGLILTFFLKISNVLLFRGPIVLALLMQLSQRNISRYVRNTPYPLHTSQLDILIVAITCMSPFEDSPECVSVSLSAKPTMACLGSQVPEV